MGDAQQSSERTYLSDLERFEQRVIVFVDEARGWHRLAGGYTSSHHCLLWLDVEGYITEMIDHNPQMECYRDKAYRQRKVIA